LAPYSPVTDGKFIWASFGSRGLYCLDMEGKKIWSKQTDKLKKAGRFGEGSSPLLVDDVIVVLADQEGQSKITAYNKSNGDIVWEQMRDEISSWSSPIATQVDGRTEIITSASNAIRSYDSKTGELIWQSRGLTGCAAPTPVVANGKVYCSTGFRGISTMVIELGHEGDLTDSDAISWRTQKVGANVPSPLVYKNQLYVFKGYSSSLSSFNAETGEEYFHGERIDGLKQVYASPIGVNGYVYVSGRNGKTAILKAGNDFDVVAVNELDTILDGSPVVVGNELFLRGRMKLYCIAKN
jgi:outer membrane protein assembly factor BamB